LVVEPRFRDRRRSPAIPEEEAVDAACPLLLTNDPDLLDDVLRLAAVAGVDIEVVADGVGARPRWETTRLAMVGVDQAGVAARLPPRDDTRTVVLSRTDRPGLAELAAAYGIDPPLVLPAAEDALVDKLVASTDPPAAPVPVVGVVGGCGGAGASIFAAALALAGGRRGQPTLLADLDPLGSGQDVLLGLERTAGLRWPDFAAAAGRLSWPALRPAVPWVRGVAVVAPGRGQREWEAAAVRAVVEAARRAGDLVVLDLPRQLPDGLGFDIADQIAVVVPTDVRSAVAADRVAAGVRDARVEAGLVVRRLPRSMPGADLVAAVGLPLLGQFGPDKRLTGLLEAGQPMRLTRNGSVSTLCDRLLDDWMPPSEAAA
jgi:secretion/DNA translocation related CpaE-like protein